MVWLGGSWFSFEVKQMHIYAVFVWIALISAYILFSLQGFVQKLHLLSIGLLLGSFHFLLQQLMAMDPILIVGNPKWDTALILAVVATVIQRKELEQIAGLSIACLLGDLYQSGMHSWTNLHSLGGSDFRDQWWLSVFAARTLTIIMQTAYGGCKAVVQSWMDRRGGWKK
ncbi:YphA family membrane protein [Paenibacillus hexagrammi]|uniref:Uncharacterized protein n=1 Tax=Paenibacillus hexagrammi TaxID=2908839 RepID=A0ABY3SSF8_9BACL|nr:hypothetical protein [Paenibacillus sp. YPD9-1]UJF36204.1 hypothetical protein L0M14_14780 [Paenibacillus sp. YPD9-1]